MLVFIMSENVKISMATCPPTSRSVPKILLCPLITVWLKSLVQQSLTTYIQPCVRLKMKPNLYLGTATDSFQHPAQIILIDFTLV